MHGINRHSIIGTYFVNEGQSSQVSCSVDLSVAAYNYNLWYFLLNLHGFQIANTKILGVCVHQSGFIFFSQPGTQISDPKVIIL